ncbi:phosphate signaling complex protein PhoU [Bacillus horti]|uniref:Phosphate-specific transport system accessory protein PhoU n=1 Tax=Caldalkalibacillus horti TaxID=77523 RepID=A0ABT9VT59_9BACI|nr:phosphate signaling complex protein PhoU [Bacillus horti]MDQ0164167.1 phosphate transport system protein [Bacillus horti]
MGVRKNFELEMNQLTEKLISMGELAEAAFSSSIEALKNQDTEQATRIIDNDEQINAIEEEIEELVVKIIASQQPVASDLRKIMSAIKITTSVERIGDFAVDIAKSTLRIGNEELVKPLQDIPAMAELVQRMIRESLQAYKTDNAELAQEISELDDKVDSLYAKIVQDLLSRMVDAPQKMDQIMQLAFVARYIERMADHVTNISEAILYSVKGKRMDLNQ